ncbi:MAG: glycosyltransferase family 39 protein [bacterium]|nr:glycosyltransferase family 39 protein [bacterium]
MKKNTKILMLIVVLATVLRFWHLTTLPALNADEAAIGYNAYSLLQTGRDEHGNPWPIHFQSFNDWKPGLYFYIVVPFVKILGLTELSVRLPGALLGVATVFLIWLLVRELFPSRRWLPEISALFLAISPWHLQFSRGGWEVNAATFFIVLGLWSFIRGLIFSRWFYLSSLSFIASLYTYHAARIVVPLLVLGLFVIYRKQLFKKSKEVLRAAIIGVVLLIPLALNLSGPAGLSRAAGVGLFADSGPFWRINQQRGEHDDFQSRFARLLHNKPINYGLAFLENYTDHFLGEFLFLSGDEIQRNRIPETGQMYLFDIVFLTAGLFAIARNPKGWGSIVLWVFVAPIAAALTFQAPHALRSQNMVVPLVIISSFGALNLFELLKKVGVKKFRVTCYILLVVFGIWNFSRYLHQYYSHMAQTYDFSSQYGFKELMVYIDENKDKYSKIVITDRYDQPYILTLFYLRYSPVNFQRKHNLTPRDGFGFSTVSEFDKFIFRSIEPWDKIKSEYPGVLIAGTDKEIPEAANVLKTIYFPSGRVAFRVVAN